MRYRIAIVVWLLAAATPAIAQTCPTGNPRVAPDSRYTVSEPVTGQRVVQDSRTGLMWKQCVQGRSGAACTAGSDSTLSWTAALSAANSESFAGHSDWRLPSVNELRSLVESGCHTPAINTVIFPTASAVFWSSSTYRTLGSNAYYVDFSIGSVGASTAPGIKSALQRVRLVRGGQWPDTFDSALDFTPDSFGFTSQVGVPQSDPRTSNAITVNGLTNRTGLQIAGASGSQYRINAGAWTSGPGNVGNGDTVELRHTSAVAAATQVTSALTIGGVAATFSSSTVGYGTPQRKLNDTAQVGCYNATTSIGTVALGTPDPETTGFDEQDCTRGGSAADAVGVMVKTGASTAPGRDYSKIANDGSVLPASATLGNGAGDWACTRDNLTGLIWEVKVNDASNLRHFNHTYTWFDSDGSSNGLFPGALGTATCNLTLANCNTTAFRDSVNTRPGGLCGASDWRLPSPKELQSLVHYDLATGPAIDGAWFPNSAAAFYWSGLSHAANTREAWVVGFNGGNSGGIVSTSSKDGSGNLVLVRGGQ